MPDQEILVIGGGFAGLWAALGAARGLDALGGEAAGIGVTLLNRDRWHAIRVRNYEAELGQCRIALEPLLTPVGIKLVVGAATSIDFERRLVTTDDDSGRHDLRYDRLILAAGSRLRRPPIPGLATHAWSIDTWAEAAALDRHLKSLATRALSAGQVALVVGAGLTGIELACELPERMRQAGIANPTVILADHEPHVGSGMGADAQQVITKALAALGVVARTGIRIAAVDAGGVALDDGTKIEAATVIWTAGMEAASLAGMVPVARDDLGRISVDPALRVHGVDGVFAAGDIAAAPLADGRTTVMSCQHARPMGRFAGWNAVAELTGRPMQALSLGAYVTCLDLGPWGAVYTTGWDRQVSLHGADAKAIKMTINRDRIYPPRSGRRCDLLAAAAPIVQAAPVVPSDGTP